MPNRLAIKKVFHVFRATVLCSFCLGLTLTAPCQKSSYQPPSPLLSNGQAADWWFVFKFNAETFPRPADAKPACLFGGTPGGEGQGYIKKIGQDYVYASDSHPALQKGTGFAGDSISDPVGATFNEIYNGNLFYVVWNDQFYRDPVIPCEASTGTSCDAPWAHSKGVLAWDAQGNGLVLQVSTPDWPGSGSHSTPRAEGNSLGCMLSDNDVDLSQHFFSLKLTEPDVLKVLAALAEEGAATDTAIPEIVKPGGPQDVMDAVAKLGKSNAAVTFTQDTLSSGVQIIAKAGGLHVAPWQMVSSVLNKAPLRVANYWQGTLIYTSVGKSKPTCWNTKLGAPGVVQIATTGIWDGTTIGLAGTSAKGSTGKDIGANHAKIGVSTASGSTLTIVGDMNQDGVLNGSTKTACAKAQNARGGMFFVIDNTAFHDSVSGLLKGNTAPTKAPAKTTASTSTKSTTSN